jgi:hypothetical protein
MKSKSVKPSKISRKQNVAEAREKLERFTGLLMNARGTLLVLASALDSAEGSTVEAEFIASDAARRTAQSVNHTLKEAMELIAMAPGESEFSKASNRLYADLFDPYNLVTVAAHALDGDNLADDWVCHYPQCAPLKAAAKLIDSVHDRAERLWLSLGGSAKRKEAA